MDNEYEELDYDDSPSEDKFEDAVTEVKTEFIEGELIYETHSDPIYKQIPKDFLIDLVKDISSLKNEKLCSGEDAKER